MTEEQYSEYGEEVKKFDYFPCNQTQEAHEQKHKRWNVKYQLATGDTPHPAPSSGQVENIAFAADDPLPPAQHSNDIKSPAPTLGENIYARSSSPPLVLFDDADDLKEESEDNSEEHHRNNNNDTEIINKEERGKVLHDVYLSEEIQSVPV